MITNEQIKEKTLCLINEVHKEMKLNLDRIVDNGEGVIKNDEFGDNYILPKLILNALLKEELYQYKMLDKSNIKKQMKLIEQLYALL